MFIVYALLDGHPAAQTCEQFLRARSGWFATVTGLLEAKAILTKVYGVEAALVTERLQLLADGLIEIVPLASNGVVAALRLADEQLLDLTDAVLLSTMRELALTQLATDDRKLAQAAAQFGLVVENPIDPQLRQQMADWERAHLPSRGLPRMLRQIHTWLERTQPAAADEFWSQTGGGSHLP
jgi:predicted nucleic acid-binding protein